MSISLAFIMILVVATGICDTISQLFLKTSINSLNMHIDSARKIFGFILKLIFIPWIWIGFVFSWLSLFIWLFVLSKTDLNFAFSLDSMHYIFIALASKYILKEKVSPIRWVGTIFIVIGIFLVTLTK